MKLPFTVLDFVRESNMIEGLGYPTEAELDATTKFLALRMITVEDLQTLVSVLQPNAVLRDRVGLNVRVGDHIPPLGGPAIVTALTDTLREANDKSPFRFSAYDTHLRYETLHPFTDGNGRSGRALWLWQRGGIQKAPLGFLHHFYYDTLAAIPNR